LRPQAGAVFRASPLTLGVFRASRLTLGAYVYGPWVLIWLEARVLQRGVRNPMHGKRAPVFARFLLSIREKQNKATS
jgi:hypothetical protein